MDTSVLDSHAIIVSLSLPGMHYVSTLRDVTQQIALNENTDDNAIRVTASTLPLARARAVRSKLDDIRSVHVRSTLPFMGTYRLLRADQYINYLAEINAYTSMALTEIDNQFGNRQDVLDDLTAQLGSIDYDPNCVPTADQIKEQCSVGPKFMPFSSMFSGNTLDKLGVTPEEAQQIQAGTQEMVSSILEEATDGVLEEITAAVDRVITSLEKYDDYPNEYTPEGKKIKRYVFHNTMVTNIRALADRLPKLDLTDDERLVGCVGPLLDVAQFDCDQLKHSSTARTQTLKKAKALSAHLDTLRIEDVKSNEFF